MPARTDRTRSLPLLGTLLGLLTGCYVEVGGAFYPSATTTVTPTAAPASKDTGVAASFLIKLGVYLDIPIRPLRTAIGVGFAPTTFGAEIVGTSAGPSSVNLKAADARIDLAAPVFLTPRVQPRLTAIAIAMGKVIITDHGSTVETPASGGGWFLGGSIGYRKLGTTLLASLGYQTERLSSTIVAGLAPTTFDFAASGVGLRFLMTFTPSGRFMQYYTPSGSGSAPSGGGCYYGEVCDHGHDCKPRYICP